MFQTTEQQILIQAINIYKELLNGNGADLTNVEASLTSIDTSLNTIETNSTSTDEILKRANWTKLLNNSIENVFYVGIEAGNPSGSTDNIKEVIYKTSNVQVFKEVITYDASDNILTITYVE